MTTAPELLQRNQPESTLHIRAIVLQVAALFLAFILFLVVVAPNQEKGLPFIGLGVVILWHAKGFLKEHAIALHCARAIGTVTEYTRDIPLYRARGSPGLVYKVRYRFATGDGTIYHGGIRTRKEQPLQGEEIEIAYNRENPADNMPRNLFFYYEKPKTFVP